MSLLAPLLFSLLALVSHSKATETKASFTLGNSSVPILDSRSLFARQYTCPSGYGLCDAGQCCELDASCCGSYNCAPADWACCGYEGQVYPLDGSECCSDGSHCPPGDSCYECMDYPGETCCYGPGDFQTSLSYSIPDVTTYSVPAALTTAIASYEAAWSSYYAEYSAYVTDYEAAWSSYYAAYSSYAASYSAAWSSYDVTYSSHAAGVNYQYYYTTYRYYYIIWYTLQIATPEVTSSSSYTSTVLSAYCTDSAEAEASFTSLAQSVDSQVSYSAVASSRALGTPSATASSSGYAGGSGSGSGSGAGAVRPAVAAVVLPVLGMSIGLLAILL